MKEAVEVPGFSDDLSHMMKQRFPFLRVLDDRNKHYQKLVVLLNEVATIELATIEKYELLYKVVEIGNLVETLCGTPEVKLEPSNLDFYGLSPTQQAVQFRVSRNIAGHFGHILYENDMQLFLRSFTLLCNGQNISQNLSNTRELTKKVNSARNIVKAIRADDMLFKLLAQMIYYLDKTALLFKMNPKAGEMAFILAGNCAKDLNYYLCWTEMKARGLKALNSEQLLVLLNTPDVSHIRALLILTIKLHEDRNPFAHCHAKEYKEMTDEARILLLTKILMSPEYLLAQAKKIVEEYFIRKHEGRVDEIFGASFEEALVRVLFRQDDESPRSYDRAVFRK